MVLPFEPHPRIWTDADGTIHVLAPAKLNLSLAIGPRRADGFHDLESLMVPLGLADELTIATGRGLSLQVDGPTAGLTPADSSNLVWKAAALLAESAHRTADAQIRLHKQIPVGGGLAGGSTDAAAALLGLTKLWNLDAAVVDLNVLAERLGSDVPFCLGGTAAWVSGRGETVRPLPPGRPLPRLWALLVLPGLHVSTAQVYAKLDELRRAGEPVDRREHELVGLRLFNDLERPALAVCAELERLHRELVEVVGVPRLLVAGSGSTLFAAFDRREEADRWKDRIAGRRDCASVVAEVQTPAAP